MKNYDVLKRLLDVAVAAPALILTLPIQLAVMMLIRIRLGRPVFFTQNRPGKGGRPFRLIKFRTMRAVDLQRGLDDDSSRMTSFGHWLRSTSLDELPTLWNILRGDMSLVGPRPLLMQYLQRYDHDQARRHEVRPGLTGLAQVAGRNALSWETKLSLDVTYVDNRSPGLDLHILWKTVAVVFRREGITASDSVTMPEFKGSTNT